MTNVSTKYRTRGKIIRRGGVLATLVAAALSANGCRNMFVADDVGVNPYADKTDVELYLEAKNTLVNVRDARSYIQPRNPESISAVRYLDDASYRPTTQPALFDDAFDDVKKSLGSLDELRGVIEDDIADMEENNDVVKDFRAWKKKEELAGLVAFLGFAGVSAFMGGVATSLNNMNRRKEDEEEAEELKEEMRKYSAKYKTS